jgi:arabinogalactan endo-1,4-beta-galactosidase
MQTVAKNIQENYGKKVLIAETSYCYTSEDGDGCGNSFVGINDLVDGYAATVQGQANMIRDICAAANEVGVLGVFYWEGTWIPVGEAAADNSPIWEKFGSGWASSYAADYDPLDAGLFYGGCSWDNQAMFDFDGYPLASLNVFKYLKYGTTVLETKDDISEVDINMTNLVQNPSFEDTDTTMWKIAYAGENNPTDYQVKADDAYTGNIAFHFWSENSDMEFSIEQEIKDLEPGTYQLSVYSQGGDISQDSIMELYAITNGAKQNVSFKVTTYADWQNPTIPEINVTDGTLTIGVRIKCNAKSWGTVDDFTLYRISD